MFDVHDSILKHDKDLDETERCQDYFNWYKTKVLLSIWNDYTAFDNNVPVDYYGNVWYHRPIMALRFHKYICYYLKIIRNQNVYYETFFTFYNSEDES